MKILFIALIIFLLFLALSPIVVFLSSLFERWTANWKNKLKKAFKRAIERDDLNRVKIFLQAGMDPHCHLGDGLYDTWCNDWTQYKLYPLSYAKSEAMEALLRSFGAVKKDSLS